MTTALLRAEPVSYFLPQVAVREDAVPSPGDFLGWDVGDWHVRAAETLAYFRELERASPRVKLEYYARSHEGKPLFHAVITSAENHARIEEIRAAHLELADPSQSATLDTGAMPAVVLLSHSIHGNEPSGANAALLVAWQLASSNDPETLDTLAGRVHLLWVRQNIQYAFMRDRFFPGTPIVEEVRHAVLEAGRVVSTETLLRREVEGSTGGWRFSSGRFHQLPDGRLLAVLTTDLADHGEQSDRALLLQELDLAAHASPPPVRVQLATAPPRNTFFTNTARGGSKPDNNIDILTTETKDGVISIRYIHVLVP
jgi:hypothetical protein